MINCPNCNHQNPDGALQCEACYTPLPALANCPNCSASIQADASFCGQCGSDLRSVDLSASTAAAATSTPVAAEPMTEPMTEPMAEEERAISTLKTQNFLSQSESDPNLDLPDLIAPDPLIEPEPISSVQPNSDVPEVVAETMAEHEGESAIEPLPEPALASSLEPLNEPEPLNAESSTKPFIEPPAAEPVVEPVASEPAPAPRQSSATQLQTTSVRLKQVQTNSTIEIPRGLSIVRIGKPNDHTPPDIDVSGFPDSEIVSRVHASIRIEGDAYYLEDVGSSNGTYINGLPLPVGNRHRLRPGDRIAFGKGDKVSFVFELAS